MTSTPASSAEPYSPSAPRALVVEDDAAIRQLAVHILRHHGFAVDEATNGREALALLNAESLFDVVVLDLWMPGMSGMQVVDQVRDTMPQLLQRILVVTGNVHELRRHPLPDICHILVKPFDVHAFISAVRSCMGSLAS